jgi:serine/threonine protein phosphatase PrpC
MKAHHTRAYSASQRKGTHSQESSPLNSSNARKDHNNIFQIPDLNSQFKYMTKNANKGNDVKLLTTNVFINNLNIQIKPQNNQKKLIMPGSDLSSGKKTSKLSPYTPLQEESKNQKLHEAPKVQGGSDIAEKNTHSHLFSGSPYNSKRDLASLLSRNSDNGNVRNPFDLQTGVSDLARTNYLAKMKGNDNILKNSFKSPTKLYSPFDANLKKKTHTKNQKSLDMNLVPQNPNKKALSFQAPPNKPPMTAENSPRDKDSDTRFTKNELFPTGNLSIGSKPVRTPGLEKAAVPSKMLINSNVQPRHRKAPSFDISRPNDVIPQKMPSNNPILDRSRKSADQGDSRFAGVNTIEPNTGKGQMRFAVRTRAGVMHNGMRKINQDSFIAHSNFGKKKDRYFFGVCDGHGMNGHFVSGFVKETLPIYMLADPHFENDPKNAMVNAFELCHQKLLVCDFDCKFSGTTCMTLLMDGNRIITANAGDSRAIMGQYTKKGWDCLSLSTDHKPNSINEAQRILRAGGRIEPFRDGDGSYVGPSRVWLMHQDIPGLAMSRSIGDIVASTVGVSCTPEIKEFKVGPEDKFMIIASDGVWEFLNNIDIVKMVAPYYEQNNLEGACDLLMNASIKRWQEEEENIVDDITLIMVFF